MLKKSWPYIMMTIVLIAVIDHGTQAWAEPSVVNVVLTSIYAVALVGGVWSYCFFKGGTTSKKHLHQASQNLTTNASDQIA